MARAKLFIGSSQKNLRVAKVLAETLEESADVTIWNEGVFGLNQGFLETLLQKLEEYDFAAFVLAPDDMTTTQDVSRPSPRDNVLFESGLFMGVLGRERVFLVYDQTAGLKIPSDLAGVTLASYDGSRIEGEDAASAVRKASRLIGDRITASRLPHLIGEWKSQYPLTFEAGSPMVDEVLEIRACRSGLSFVTKSSSLNDYYTAVGQVFDRQIIGRWKSREGTNEMEGVFILLVSPNVNFMYGYFTSPDERGGVLYATWILAKMAGADEAKISERMNKADEMLRTNTVVGPTPQKPG